VGDNRLIQRNFVVIKDENNDIVCFTKLHKYIHSRRKNAAKSISDDGNNRFIFVSQFLNYILIRNYSKYGIDKICDFTYQSIQDFFYDYGSLDENGYGRTKITVDRCCESVMSFLAEYIKTHSLRCKLRLGDIIEDATYITKRGIRKTYKIPKFEIIYSGVSKEILRDMPDSVFQMILSYSMTYYKEILMLIALSAFTGMRPAEACNVRQEISPLGSGIIISKLNNRVNSISIDLRSEMVLRSDLKSVGCIKKERMQKVYSKFITPFMQCYKIYLEYIADKKYEKEYCPLSINRWGKAMTYNSYRQIFNTMIAEMQPLMFNSENEQIQEFGHLLLEHHISPHIFRHWFSVRLTILGESAATLKYWRGDKNPESAITYLQNKSELSYKFKEINNDLFDAMLEFSIRRKDQL